MQVHREYVERRIGGGAPPTSDAYAEALAEFHEIPGAIRLPASEATADTVRRRTQQPGEPEETESDQAAAEESAAADETAAGAEEAVETEADTGGVWESER
ncbi:hypothetical protein AB0E69_26215 [Kribbella sp. NPDC026611]|uniref:hypothetical protein n=1 Tax=Kribbella sp. NPDC026611 TaxID=3154911 RepID=UPI0033FBAA57